MRLYLVQHGQSKSEEEDPQRRLTDKGIGEVQKVADFLRPLGFAVDVGRRRSRHQGHLSVAWRAFRPENRRRLGPPAQKGVPSYKVTVEGDDIKVEV